MRYTEAEGPHNRWFVDTSDWIANAITDLNAYKTGGSGGGGGGSDAARNFEDDDVTVSVRRGREKSNENSDGVGDGFHDQMIALLTCLYAL